MEQKIDGIVARLADGTATQPASSLRSPPAGALRGPLLTPSTDLHITPTTATEARPGHPEGLLEHLAKIHSFSQNAEELESPASASSSVPSHVYNDDGAEDYSILRNIVSLPEAETLLVEYREMCRNFPFVPLPASMNAHLLCSSKPVLLLAIVTVASWKDREKQKLLGETYLQELAKQSIASPRKDLSLVQSLLVYLAW